MGAVIAYREESEQKKEKKQGEEARAVILKPDLETVPTSLSTPPRIQAAVWRKTFFFVLIKNFEHKRTPQQRKAESREE
jgi:hypothetical protein